MHTVFSDGSVWPDIRAEEAWREGLDAIAITDHLEYRPHKEDLPANHNRSFEIAKPAGDALQVIVIKGSEVTREMPPGHLNAIFIRDSNPLDQPDWRGAVKAAGDQGAFIFWNHPGWTGQQEDGIAKWYPEQTELIEQKLLHGMEVANDRDYYPEVHRWCIEKGLTMLGNSDIHPPVNLQFQVHAGDHRPMTLVFAREATGESIKEALFAGRTAVYTGDLLIGLEPYLRPLFEQSVSLRGSSARLVGRRPAYLQVTNQSDLQFRMELAEQPADLEVQQEVVVEAGKTVLLEVRARRDDLSGSREVDLTYDVTNLKITPESGLKVRFPVHLDLEPKQ